MFCKNCGKELTGDAKFCPACGAAAETAPASEAREGSWISPNIALGQDGKYRWVYEMDLFRNPTVVLLVWKIFFFILLGIFAFTAVVDLFEWGFSGERLLETLKMFLWFLLGMTVLVTLGVLIYAAVMGGKYCVMFEMDEGGVTHRQMPRQAKKAELIGLLAVLAGVASGRYSTVGAGIASARTEMSTEFALVRRVRISRRTRVIRIRQLLSNNQVYAAPEDFDFVCRYILDRVPEKARPKK